MTNPAVRSRMTHRAAITRDTEIGTDNFGQPQTAPKALCTVPCLAWASTIRRVVGEKLAVIPVVEAVVPSAADVAESDQVASVTNREGVVIFSGPMTVLSVEDTRNGFKTVLARRAKAA